MRTTALAALALSLAPAFARAEESVAVAPTAAVDPVALAPTAADPVALAPVAGPDAVTEEPGFDEGPQTVFQRANDLASLRAQTFTAGYAIESGKNFGEGAEPMGIGHRLQAGYGVTDWLKLSLEQNMKHRVDTKEFKVGVLAPELRLTLAGMLPDESGDWPLDVSAFFAPRIRIMGRRDPAMVVGFGTNTPRGPLHFTVNNGLEVSVPDREAGNEQTFGPRYDLGVGYEVGYGFVTAAEVWGHAAWSRGGYEEQEHHAGLSLLYVYDIGRFGLGGSGGWREQVTRQYADARGMFTLGLEI